MNYGLLVFVAFGFMLSACATAPQSVPPAPPPTVDTTVDTIEHCVLPAIDWMNEQKILYTQNPADEWRDCSGNFLRLSSRVAQMCPEVELVAAAGIKRFVPGGNNKRPQAAQARTTRGIAKWYDDKKMFIPIFYDGTADADAPSALSDIRNKIKPGSVLWFSQTKPLLAHGKEGLYKEAGGVINHMGTIVSVKKDALGNVIEWTMYHGQNPRKHNGITEHYWDWPDYLTSRGQVYPPGGYWKQRIVGFAESMIPYPAT